MFFSLSLKYLNILYILRSETQLQKNPRHDSSRTGIKPVFLLDCLRNFNMSISMTTSFNVVVTCYEQLV